MTESSLGHNSRLTPEQAATVARLHGEILSYKAQAKSMNDKANANRKEMKAMGLDLQAYSAATARAAMDVDQRMSFDMSVASINEALGIPVQGNLFGDDTDGEDDSDIPSGPFN